jgi:hypothetical protein
MRTRDTLQQLSLALLGVLAVTASAAVLQLVRKPGRTPAGSPPVQGSTDQSADRPPLGAVHPADVALGGNESLVRRLRELGL